jgi:uroporphyrin-III C-methyltransferase/precorrin-2 dehydrogenase/sirohydrochlorin ferrochelatase
VAPGDPASLVDWPALARLRGTVVLMMAVERIGAFADALMAGRPPETPVVVVQDGTTRIQKTLRTTLGAVAADVRSHEIAPPAVIVVGPVAGLVAGPVSQ